MRFFRNNAYWILGILIGIGISTVILIQRGKPQQDTETAQHTPSAEPNQQGPRVSQSSKRGVKPPPPGETTESGHWRNGVWHKTSPVPTPVRKESIMSRLGCGVISPQPILYTVGQLKQKREWRKMMEADEITREEYSEKVLQLTVGDMDMESAVRFYEKHGNYSPALLARLDTVSAFKHLKVVHEQITFHPNTRSYDLLRAHAERVLSETASDSPEHFEAKLFLADTDQDASRAVSLYRELLQRDPYSQHIVHSVLEEAIPVRRHIYVHLGNRLWRDQPEEAIPYLKLAAKLDEPHGDYPVMSNHILGEAYERIGDYKTAWVYHKRAYKKTGHWKPKSHIKAIEAGTPYILPIAEEKFDVSVPHDMGNPFDVDNSTSIPETFPEDTPHWSDDSPSLPLKQDTVDPEATRAAAAKKAREEFKKLEEITRNKEFNDFFEWVESIENAASPIDTNNFLMKEMEIYLKGGEAQFDLERIIRAFETMERYGAKEGIKHLQKNDPDVAAQVQRLLEAKRPKK